MYQTAGFPIIRTVQKTRTTAKEKKEISMNQITHHQQKINKNHPFEMKKEINMLSQSKYRSPISRLKKILVLTLALVIMFSALPADNAYAWSVTRTVGQRGAVSIPQVSIADLYMPWGMTQFTLLTGTGPLVYRNPGSTGTQFVGGQYLMEKWNGSSWVVVARTQMFSRTIYTGQSSVRFPAMYMQPINARGSFRIVWIFTWMTASGTSLGSTRIQSSLVADHQCVTPIRLCRSYAGYFRTGLNNTTW
jgi:hypothetical protein